MIKKECVNWKFCNDDVMYMILWKKYIKLDYIDIDSESFNKLLLFNFVEIGFRALLFYFCFLFSHVRDAENVHLNK